MDHPVQWFVHGFLQQVPEVMHYRESALDKSIIVFIICLNVAEFLCHIFIFRARFSELEVFNCLSP